VLPINRHSFVGKAGNQRNVLQFHPFFCKQNVMDESDKDKTKGKVDQAVGKVKEKVGQATDNPDMEEEGTAEKLKGKVQDKVGDVKKVFEK